MRRVPQLGRGKCCLIPQYHTQETLVEFRSSVGCRETRYVKWPVLLSLLAIAFWPLAPWFEPGSFREGISRNRSIRTGGVFWCTWLLCRNYAFQAGSWYQAQSQYKKNRRHNGGYIDTILYSSLPLAVGNRFKYADSYFGVISLWIQVLKSDR